MMAINRNIETLVPRHLRDLYEIHEWRNALPILVTTFPKEWNDITKVLTEFRLHRSNILEPGKNKSTIAGRLDQGFYDNGWTAKSFDTKIIVDEATYESPTHGVDCFKNGVAIEVEWNNKDPFYDRDLNNFRLLFDLRAISVGVIITRSDDLQKIFNDLGKGSSYGNSTTHMSKLLPRIEGGGGGGCPIVVFGIGSSVYVDSA